MPREWDAASYDSLPLPHLRWGERAIGRLQFRGDERVLDAGCGPGRVTEQLLDRLPHGSVVAVDASQAMLAQLRLRMASQLDRIEVIHADLTRPLPLAEPVDAILSTATFHWIADHELLFRNLARILRPGGIMVVDCGGRGNIARVNEAIAAAGGAEVSQDSWNFAGPEETTDRLASAGFGGVETWLEPDPAIFETDEVFEAYLATVVLGAHLDVLSAEEKPRFVRAVAAQLPERIVDYVRLNIVAKRSHELLS